MSAAPVWDGGSMRTTSAPQSASWRTQVGPARATAYLSDQLTLRSPRRWWLAASALGSATEWIGCAVVPAAVAAACLSRRGAIRRCGLAITAVYGAQLVIVERAMGTPAHQGRRIARVLACPVASTVFGLGGIEGAFRLAAGSGGLGKTERTGA